MFLMNSGVRGKGDSKKSLLSTAKLLTFHLPNSLDRNNNPNVSTLPAAHLKQVGNRCSCSAKAISVKAGKKGEIYHQILFKIIKTFNCEQKAQHGVKSWTETQIKEHL